MYTLYSIPRHTKYSKWKKKERKTFCREKRKSFRLTRSIHSHCNQTPPSMRSNKIYLLFLVSIKKQSEKTVKAAIRKSKRKSNRNNSLIHSRVSRKSTLFYWNFSEKKMLVSVGNNFNSKASISIQHTYRKCTYMHVPLKKPEINAAVK